MHSYVRQRRTEGGDRRKKKGYDDPDFVEVKQPKAGYENDNNILVADHGDNFFPKQYFANPFLKPRGNNYNLDHFFPKDWKPGTKYEQRLLETAKDLLNNTNNEVSKASMSEVVSGINPLHPFLEVGGALRTQVPLPMDMAELFSLIDVILNHNPDNIDAWKMPKDGFKAADKTIPTAIAFEEGQSTMLWTKVPYQANRNILIWDDVAGSAGVNKACAAPNFVKLLGSIIFQRSDEIAYDARGRYGAHVVRRLVDSHAYKNDDNSRTVIAFAYEKDTGFPYGYYAGLLSQSKVNITGFIPKNTNNNRAEVTCPSLLLNYTFCMDKPYLYYGKTTSLMTSHLLAYLSKYVTGLGPEKHLLAIHTDKSAASKSTQSMMTAATTPVAYTTNDAVARDIFKTINRGAGKNAFTYLFPAAGFAGLIRVDQSTVPLMDAGEEVPEPCDRFYRGIFDTYSDLVAKHSADKIEDFKNGKLFTGDMFSVDSLYLPSNEARQTIEKLVAEHNFDKICDNFQLDQKEVINWLQSPNSLDDMVIGKKRTAPVLGKDLSISNQFPLNFGCRWEGLNTTIDTTPKALQNKKNPKAQQTIFECIRFWAKLGNTANQYHEYKNKDANPQLGAAMTYVPRLTDMGFIIVGSIDTFGPICATANEKVLLNTENYSLKPVKNSTLSMFDSNMMNYLQQRLEGSMSRYNFSQIVQRVLNLLKPISEITGPDIQDSIDDIIDLVQQTEQ